MASHAPQTILFVTNEGLVMNTGSSTRLAKGQLGLVDKMGTPTALGLPILSAMPPAPPKNNLYELKLGIAPLTPTRSQSNKSYSTRPFKISEVVDIKVHAPKNGIGVDEFIIGYDGINANTAITMANGDNEVIDICLYGEAIGMLGYPDAKVTVKLHLEAPNTGTFTMHQIIEDGVKRLKDVTLVGGVPITEYIDITPVNSTNPSTVSGTPYSFYTLTVSDNGNYSALGLIQAQYPGFLVKRESYTSGTATAGISKYVILAPTSTSIPAYQVFAPEIYADCEVCPDGYSLHEEDGLCINDANPVAQASWIEGAACTAIGVDYTLQLKDDECGNDKLAELQLVYPELSISIVEQGACQTVYTTTVISDVVCEECSPLLRDLFVAEAPMPFEFIHWTTAPTVYNAAALMGIRVKGRVNIFAGSEEYRDDIPFVYSSTRLVIANEAPGSINESFTIGNNGRFAVKALSIATEPESIGFDLYDLEERTRVYFENRQRLAGNNYGKLVLGQESHLKPLSHYVTYSMRVRTVRFAQSFSGEVVENFDYIIAVEVGKHHDVQNLINSIAAAAGLPTVTAMF